MFRRHVGFAEKYDEGCLRMAFSHFPELPRSMTITRADSAHVFARHAIEAIESIRMLTSRGQQLKQRLPVVAPVVIEAQAFTQFLLADLTTPPRVKNRLVARQDCLNSEHDPAFRGQLLNQSCGISLRGRQSVIVTD